MRRTLATAEPSVPGVGVSTHHRLRKSSAKPASGPEFSVPAMGWPGTKWTPSGRCGSTTRITDVFTDPTSVTTAPGRSAGAIAAATSPYADTGVPITTRSAPSTAASGASATVSTIPSSRTRSRVARVRANATWCPATPLDVSARASELLISPQPM